MSGTILDRILARKAEEIALRRTHRGEADLRAACIGAPEARGFGRALASRLAQGQSAVIAEIKKASPSKGLIREDFDPPALARSYAAGGAACLSVLTDVDFFQGADAYLQAARAAVSLPVLRKDFTIDSYQVLEARVLGADCILLIVAAFAGREGAMHDLAALAAELGMDVLVEVHDAAELAQALAVPGALLGINNRDLRSFATTLDTTFSLLPHIPAGRLVITESGIGTSEDVAAMRAHGVDAFLVGESLMRCPDPGERLRELFF